MSLNFVIHFLMWLLVTLLLLMTTSSNNAVEGIKVIGSTNVSTVQVGQPFTFKCEVTEYELNEYFEIWFYYTTTNDYFAEYIISDSKSTNSQANFFNFANSYVNRKYISQVQPLVHRYPAYEISITPKKAFSTEFYCNFYQPNKTDFYFNHVPVTVVQFLSTPITPLPPTTAPPKPSTQTPSSPTTLSETTTTSMPLPSTTSTPTPSTIPQITLTSNESTVHINHPFTVTCTISNFENSGKKYLVNYFNNRNGLLASYEVDVSGRAYLSSEDHISSVSVNYGPRQAYPVFDLVVDEKINNKLSYWCELVVPSGGSPETKKYQSPTWKPTGPFVDFTSTFNSSNLQHQGRCTIDELENFSNLVYQVLFYSNLGGDANENLLGYFTETNNKSQFIYEHPDFPWMFIAHGTSVSYPNFEIITKVNENDIKKTGSNRSSWWCVLKVGQQEQANYRLIKSNKNPLLKFLQKLKT